MLLHPEMGFQGKDPEAVKRPTAGISPPRTPLRSIRTRPSSEGDAAAAADGEEDHLLEGCPSGATTPTAKGARIPERLPCPPAPRKRRPPPRCRRSGGVEFFSCPPDLEAVFLRRPDREGQVK